MQTNAYSVYDNKALVYGTPFFAPTDGSAIRLFTDLANDANSTVARHPGDFSLFCVGRYDDQKGELVPTAPLRHVVDASAVVILRNGSGDRAALDVDLEARFETDMNRPAGYTHQPNGEGR